MAHRTKNSQATESINLITVLNFTRSNLSYDTYLTKRGALFITAQYYMYGCELWDNRFIS